MNLRFEKRHIGESVRYPGHPIVLAYLITQKYSSLNQALRKNLFYLKVLEDKDIIGADKNIYAALEFLHQSKNINFNKAWQEAQEDWKTLTDGYNDDVIAHGAKQALMIKEKIIEKLKSWR